MGFDDRVACFFHGGERFRFVLVQHHQRSIVALDTVLDAPHVDDLGDVLVPGGAEIDVGKGNPKGPQCNGRHKRPRASRVDKDRRGNVLQWPNGNEQAHDNDACHRQGKVKGERQRRGRDDQKRPRVFRDDGAVQVKHGRGLNVHG